MAFSAAAPLSLVPAASTRAFAELDERLVGAQPGVVIVHAPVDVHASIAAHAARRLRTNGFAPIVSALRAGAPLFREVATQLGLGTLPCDALACAEAIGEAMTAKRAALVLPLPSDGTWDRAVASELARTLRTVLVFVTSAETPAWDPATTTTFDVTGQVDVSEKLRWLSAVAEEAQSCLPASDLQSLEAWWSQARRVTPDAAITLDALGDPARDLLTCLVLAGRSIALEAIRRMRADAPSGGKSALDELIAAGAIVESGGLVSLSATRDFSELEASATDAQRIDGSRLLLGAGGDPGAFDPDPWAYARAAELLVSASAFSEADDAITKASRGVSDTSAAREIASRWQAAVEPVSGEGGLMLRIRAAQRALAVGEAADAQHWCERAAAIQPTDAEISLLMGRALRQLGDLVASRVSLQRAATLATTPDQQARVATELAEVHYVGGELKKAAELATQAIEAASSVATRLAARGTIGKIHLAAGEWDEADAHFAEDAITASAHGEKTAELRARLNRAIALMSKGLLEESRTTLERVLADGTSCGEDRACAYALSNLGVVAYRQHDYASALTYWERTIKFPQALRGRMAAALTIANLAELRLRLGLVDHAEHALAFGRKLLAGSAPPARSAHFKWVAAQVSLARRNTEAARREIDGAIFDAQASRDREYLDIASIVAARIALEDGDLARAAHAIAQAESTAASARARAEIAIVRAMYLRASGQGALDAANEALSLARAAGEDDLLAEIHALQAMLHRDSGDLQAAQAHCCRAIAVRDHVAADLPPDIRAAFLAKPEILMLSRLQASLVHDNEVEEEAPRTVRVLRPVEASAAREIVGEDPQIRSLLIAIKKVARANSTVLIRGESGTGKELVAEALHHASERAAGPLVSVNCAALVETLLLSELFGHEKGAFTGATSRRRGRFELAEGGTLFLDEIGDISPRTQVALLRVLQEKTFERVGGAQAIRANVRVLCATHRDLKAMVERGEFREDLYYRLRGITLEVPALRARLGDLPKLAEHLLGRIATERSESAKRLAPDALDLLQRHRWPGNIRELENVLRAVSLFADGDVITAADLIDNVDDLRSVAQAGPLSQPPISLRASLLPPPLPSLPAGAVAIVDGDDDESGGSLPDDEANATAVAYAQVRQGAVSLADIKRQIERDCIARALSETKGNITRAAALLGMKRPRLSQLVKQYGLSATSCDGGGSGQ